MFRTSTCFRQRRATCHSWQQRLACSRLTVWAQLGSLSRNSISTQQRDLDCFSESVVPPHHHLHRNLARLSTAARGGAVGGAFLAPVCGAAESVAVGRDPAICRV